MHKKLFALAAFCFMSFQTIHFQQAHAQALDPITGAENIIPALAPLVKDIFDKSFNVGKNIIGKLSDKKTRCDLCNDSFSCKTKVGISSCKSMCQDVQQVGGYELRVRFGQDWSLAGCLRKGVDAGIQPSSGRGNLKSIAVYSEKDYKIILELISRKTAAEEVVHSGGKDLNIHGDERDRIVAEAEKSIHTIDKYIQDQVQNGRFGNQ